MTGRKKKDNPEEGAAAAEQPSKIESSESIAQLIAFLQQQMAEQQRERDRERAEFQRQMADERAEQQRLMADERAEQQRQMAALIAHLSPTPGTSSIPPASTSVTALTHANIPNFTSFDATSELWKDYWARFQTFAGAHSIPDDKMVQVFLTNQNTTTYKLISTMAKQLTPPKDINELSLDEITEFMEKQFDPKRFVVRERFKFWSNMERKPSETVQELAARIRQDAATCDFSSIADPQDEAMRTRFICSINNEAALKALFKHDDKDLTFAKAIQVASETEDADKVAKETVHGNKTTPVYKVDKKKSTSTHKTHTKQSNYTKSDRPCIRCGKTGHQPSDCRYKDTKCHYCEKKGHLEAVCLQKKKHSNAKKVVGHIVEEPFQTVKYIKDRRDKSPIIQPLQMNKKTFNFEVDTGSEDNFCSSDYWIKLGKPPLQPARCRYISATRQDLPVLGVLRVSATLTDQDRTADIDINVTSLPDLNLLGRSAVKTLHIDIQKLLNNKMPVNKVHTVQQQGSSDQALQKACIELCSEFHELFQPGLGCLKELELEVAFKPDAKPFFCKPRTVPYAILDDLNQAIDAGIEQGVWEPTQFCEYGTPVVPVRKALLPGQQKAKLRVCGDYSVAVNSQLDTHRHPMPLPEDLMNKLSGSYYFSKIDMADAYQQIKLGPESQRRLALSTHRGVLLQKRLPYGISSAPGYFQEIMEQLTRDLRGVAIYLDDILVSGSSAEEHLQNLRALLKRLQDKGLRCNKRKCSFAQSSVEYLGYTLSRHGVSKGRKVDAILKMPPPMDVTGVRSFLGSVQFYGKWIPSLSTLAEPLNQLTRKDKPWRWGKAEQSAFQQLKEALCSDNVLAHFDPSQQIGISCDASEVGIGVVLFHRFKDGTERPIANASKTLTDTQRRYSQIQKEALAVIFALKKFHQFLYGRNFILVTDHKPLIALFGPKKGIPAMAANRLARWALMLSQYDYTIEYRKTTDHGNADALSRLPAGEDLDFDGEEEEEDISMVCTIKTISQQLNPTDPGLIAKESRKDPVISMVIRYVTEGWPQSVDSDEIKHYKKLINSLCTENGCLFHGARLVIPARLKEEVLQLIHLGHFGMQRMKQLARTVVYWHNIDSDIEQLARTCTACAEHQNKPAKPANHPWMMPEKRWSRIHLDHAINFMGNNWLVVVDAYSKFPCIHATTSTSTKATINLLEEDFSLFGYPHTIVTDNATTFMSDEFKEWCHQRGIIHLTGAPYHPATNGQAERLVQTFKQSLRKSSLPPKAALQEFLMQYRRTPLDCGLSPSELLNRRQIRCQLDALVPSPAHVAQGQQSKETAKSHRKETSGKTTYTVGSPCYALHCGPKLNKESKWVPAIITKVRGSRSVEVKTIRHGQIWRRHIDQLRPRYTDDEANFRRLSKPPENLPTPKTISTGDNPRRSQRLKYKST